MGSPERLTDSGRQPAPSRDQRGQAAAAREALERILASPGFKNADRMSRFLRFVVERTVEGKLDDLKEYSIGVEVFDRGADFDPRLDPVVRVEARRLRKKLDEYYASEGARDPLRIGLPKGGYAVEFGEPERTPAPADSATDAATRTLPAPGRWVALTLVVLAAAILLASVALRSRRVGAPSQVSSIESLAVLPLQNLSGDASQEYFVDGLTEALVTDLAQIRALKVISRTSVMKFKGTTESVPDIGKELHVDAVVEGSVVLSGKHVRITAQLIETRSDTHLWAKAFEGDLQDILSLQNQVAKAIAEEVRAQLTPQEQAQLASVHLTPPDAEEAYLKGRYLWNQRTPASAQQSIKYLEDAIRIDPRYAQAYSALADAYVVLLSFDAAPSPAEAAAKGKQAAKQALRLDETLGQPHTALAHIMFLHDWNFAGAEKEYKLGLERSPGSGTAHHWYGDLLMFEGRFAEGDRELKKAFELDPLSLVIPCALSLNYSLAGKQDQGIAVARQVLLMNPNFSDGRAALGFAYETKGMRREAIEEYQKYVELSGRDPDALAGLAWAYVADGKTDEARRLLCDLLNPPKGVYVAPNNVAAVYALLGEKDRAFELLDRAARQHVSGMILLPTQPFFAGIRSDPRYEPLLRQIGFAQWPMPAGD